MASLVTPAAWRRRCEKRAERLEGLTVLSLCREPDEHRLDLTACVDEVAVLRTKQVEEQCLCLPEGRALRTAQDRPAAGAGFDDDETLDLEDAQRFAQ